MYCPALPPLHRLSSTPPFLLLYLIGSLSHAQLATVVWGTDVTNVAGPPINATALPTGFQVSVNLVKGPLYSVSNAYVYRHLSISFAPRIPIDGYIKLRVINGQGSGYARVRIPNTNDFCQVGVIDSFNTCYFGITASSFDLEMDFSAGNSGLTNDTLLVISVELEFYVAPLEIRFLSNTLNGTPNSEVVDEVDVTNYYHQDFSEIPLTYTVVSRPPGATLGTFSSNPTFGECWRFTPEWPCDSSYFPTGYQIGSLPGTYVIEATCQWCVPAFPGSNRLTVIATGIQLPDLEVTKVQPVQVVASTGEFTRPFVAKGRPVVVDVEVAVNTPSALSGDVPVELLLDTTEVGRKLIPKALFEANNCTANCKAKTTFTFTPKGAITSPGSSESKIRAVVNPPGDGHLEEAGGDNNEMFRVVTLGHKRSLRLSFVKITDWRGWRPSSDVTGSCVTRRDPPISFGQDIVNLAATAAPSKTFVIETFPVSEVSGTALDVSFAGTPNTTPRRQDKFTQGVACDLLLASRYGSKKDPFADVFIAIAPENYFSAHGLSAAEGAGALETGSGIIANNGNYTTAAHETGHAIGLIHIRPDNSSDPDPVFTSLVQRGDTISTKTFHSLMAGQSFSTTPDQRWVDEDTYESLAIHLPQDGIDPALIMIGGFISGDGSIELWPWDFSAEGIPSRSNAGDYEIGVMDRNGISLSVTQIPVKFTPPAGGSASFDSVPFFAKVPYPSNAVTVFLNRQGIGIARIEISSKLLADAVRTIPNGGFQKNADQVRKSLLNKINALGAQILAGEVGQAATKLRDDIRKSLQNNLVDDYAVETPLQYTKEGLLALVDELIKRLKGI